MRLSFLLLGETTIFGGEHPARPEHDFGPGLYIPPFGGWAPIPGVNWL